MKWYSVCIVLFCLGCLFGGIALVVLDKQGWGWLFLMAAISADSLLAQRD